MQSANLVQVFGQLIEIEGLKYTPAGIPILHFRLSHESEQHEAGGIRKVSFEMHAIAVEREARMLASAKLGMHLVASGFLDRKTRLSNQLMLHATHIEFTNQD